MRQISTIGMVLFGVAAIAVAILAGCASTQASTPEIQVAKKQEVPAPRPEPCPDGDRDHVCDADDRCPMKIGPPATLGCPVDPCGGSPLLVLVQFKYDSSEMPAEKKAGVQTMDPVLDAVAEAIARDPSCRVCIVGYASEEGTPEYNQDLSRRRARAVRDYLTAHNLTKTRMPTSGMGERCQLVPESTRELNRRVEFRRLNEGKSCPMECSD